MAPNSAQQLRALFDATCGLPSAESAKILDKACAGDRELRDKLDALLAADRKTEDIFSTPCLTNRSERILAELSDSPPNRKLPKTIGCYRVLRKIGMGSTAIVYAAEQAVPKRHVAIKVLRPGVSTTPMLRRFEREAHVLGRLNHPYIAQIFDAGTTDHGSGPQPFFVMDLVEGIPLTQYAREGKVSQRGRLELLAKVCDAVHHAHTNGVIHRDLKPDNILVDGCGCPRILDFGIARVTDGTLQVRTLHTTVGQLVGTLQYMSPEQASGEPDQIDTRSDIYALGAVGYELLSGHSVYDLGSKKLPEAIRIITETDPRTLGTIDKTLRGDVETIIAKALEKDRTRRYMSASDLATDIRRYFRDEPIRARPPSVLYQLGKYARREKAWFAGAVALGICFLLGVAGTGYGLVRAIRERDIAESRRQDAELARLEAGRQAYDAEQQRLDAERLRSESETVTQLLVQMLRAANPEELGRDVLLRDVLNATVKTFESELTDQPLIEARLRSNLGETYSAIGDYSNAIAQAEIAASLYVRELGPSHENTLDSESNLATVRGMAGDYDAAIPELERILAAKRETMEEENDSLLHTMNSLGLAYSEKGQYAEAEPLLRRTLSVRQSTLGDNHMSSLSSETNLAILYLKQGKYEVAESMLVRIEETCSQTLGERHPKTFWAARNLAQAYYEHGRHAEAEALQLRCLADSREVYGDRHPHTINLINNLAELYRTVQQFQRAESLYAEAIAYSREVFGSESPKTLVTLYNQALMFQEQRLNDKAKPVYVELLESIGLVLGDDHPKTQDCRNNLAAIYVEEGEYDAALPLYLNAVQGFEAMFGTTHPRVLACRSNIGELYRKMGRLDPARAMLTNVVNSARETLPERHWFLGVFLVKQGRCLIDTQQFQEANTALVEGHSILLETFGPDHGRTVDAAAALRELAEKRP